MCEPKVFKESFQGSRHYWTCQVVCKGMVQEKWNFNEMMQDEKLSQFISYLMIDITQTRLTRSDGCIWKMAPDSATLRRSITKPTEQLFTPLCEHELSFLLPFFSFLFFFVSLSSFLYLVFLIFTLHQ